MSRERLRELMKKHKENRNERIQKRNTEITPQNLALSETPPLNELSNFRTILQKALQDNQTPNLKRNPFTPLVMPDKLNNI